ncbi:hypothetical protein J3458_003682 [Metarhizium acridum]|uniref:uncharacterized protein n=1 Tax=Metarhizium acridum TaxID=92637 RepID=UPI001C6C2893|nr:hypothetical protein J3458_003682 [Metarhizium acridum]
MDTCPFSFLCDKSHSPWSWETTFPPWRPLREPLTTDGRDMDGGVGSASQRIPSPSAGQCPADDLGVARRFGEGAETERSMSRLATALLAAHLLARCHDRDDDGRRQS